MKAKFKRRLPGLLITVMLCVAMVVFMLGLAHTKLFPTKLLLLSGGILVLVAVIIGLLTRDSKRTGSMIAGIVLTVLMLIILVAGTYYLSDAVKTLSNMTQVKVEITDMGVYVRADDPAQDLNEAAAYNFGIMKELDRENTDKVLVDLCHELNTSLAVKEYDGLEELVDGLVKDRQVDAIVLNSAYLELLGDTDEYADVEDSMRQLQARQVETVVENAVQATTPPKQETGNIFNQLFNDNMVEEEEVVNNSFAMYISGIDSRSGLIAKSRSDVNILAVVNPDTRQVLLVSTPRDFYVPLPISNGVPDKLTHAGIYGVDVSIGTLEMLYGIDIDYYFRVNFSGFEKIVDALGGITVNSEKSFTSQDGYSYQKGANKLNGAKALSFARERKAFASGDRQRGTNQMAVIKAVIEKAVSPAILKNYKSLMESVSGSFETSMPYDKIAELVRNQLEDGGDWNIVSMSVDGTGDSKRPYSLSTRAYVMIPNQETVDAAIAKIQQVINGEVIE